MFKNHVHVKSESFILVSSFGYSKFTWVFENHIHVHSELFISCNRYSFLDLNFMNIYICGKKIVDMHEIKTYTGN